MYEAGEEDERPVVADRTKLLFALIFTLPTLAVLLSIATYDPPSVGELADAARSAGERAALDELTDSGRTLRGGALQLPQRRQLLTLTSNGRGTRLSPPVSRTLAWTTASTRSRLVKGAVLGSPQLATTG